MFLSLDPKFKKEESRSGFQRRGGPSMVCNVRYQAPHPQQLWNITDKKADYSASGGSWEQQLVWELFKITSMQNMIRLLH